MKSEDSKDSGAVRVAVRSRPLNAKEKLEKCRECVKFLGDGSSQIIVGKDRSFTFDHTFDENTRQFDVYDTCVAPLVESIFNGINATCLAYGQTGSGKTFTMGTANTAGVAEQQLGVIPRVIQDIFDKIEEKKGKAEFMIRVSSLEIYNEELKDLLHPGTSSKNITIREDADGSILVIGIREEVVTSYSEMIGCLERGNLNRTTGSTLMNESSSRSHSIFTIILEQTLLQPPTEEEASATASSQQQQAQSSYMSAKFHLVDLAGSERAKRTGAVGQRFKEAVTINCGLLALGNVISALGDEKRRATVTHVPYRDSKLTRLLQDSLGGNSRTLMIACISPADSSFEETLNTLKYANRARNIINKPVVNRDPHSAQLSQLKNKVQMLEMALLKHNIVLDENGNLVGVGDVKEGSYSFQDLIQDDANRHEIESLKQKTIRDSHISPSISTAAVASYKKEREILENQISTLRAQLENSAKRLSIQQDSNSRALAMLKKLSMSHTTSPQQSQQPEKDSSPMMNQQAFECISQAIAALSGGTSGVGAEPSDGVGVGVGIGDSDQLRQLKTKLIKQGEYIKRLEEERKGLLDVAFENENEDFEVESVERGGDKSTKLARFVRALEGELNVARDLIAQKETELKEAQEDLARDEEIFSVKVKEIKTLKQQLRDLQKEKKKWMSQVSNSGPMQNEGQSSNQLGQRSPYESVVKHIEDESDGVVMAENDQSKMPAEREVEIFMEEEDDRSAPIGTAEIASDVTELETEVRKLEQTKERLIVDKERLLADKLEIEQEKQRVEQQAREQEHSFQTTKSDMERHLKNLTIGIKLKEELIKELIKSEHELKNAAREYEQKIRDMETQMKGTQAELDRALKELETADMEQAKKDRERERLQKDYESKIRQVTEELSELRKKQKENDRLLREKQAAERKLRDFVGEVDSMKKQQEILKSKLKEESTRQEEIAQEKSRMISALKKESESSLKRIRELEAENEKTKAMLLKKAEEVAKAQQKLKDVSFNTSSLVPTPRTADPHRRQTIAGANMRPMSAFGVPGEIPRAATPVVSKRRGSTAMSPPPASPIPPAVERLNPQQQRAWLEKAVESVLSQKEANDRLEKELERRESIIAEREAALARKAKLETKILRESQSANKNLATFSQQLKIVENQIQMTQKEIDVLNLDGDVPGGRAPMLSFTDREFDPAKCQKLLKDRERLKQQRGELETRCVEEEKLLNMCKSGPDTDLLREIEERIENLQSELEFKDDSISQAKKELDMLGHAGASSNPVHERLSKMSNLSDLRSTALLFFDKIVELKDQERRKEERVQTLENGAKEMEKMIEGLQDALKQSEVDSTRRLTKMQKDHDVALQSLMKELQSVKSAAASASVSGPLSPTSNPMSSPTGQSSVSSLRSPSPFVTPSSESNLERAPSPLLSEKGAMLEAEQLQILQRDNFYYKNTNRELKRKLRELRDAVDSGRSTIEQALSENRKLQDEIRRLSESNQSLASELRSHKELLRRQQHHYTPTPQASLSRPGSTTSMISVPPIKPPVGGGVGTPSPPPSSRTGSARTTLGDGGTSTSPPDSMGARFQRMTMGQSGSVVPPPPPSALLLNQSFEENPVRDPSTSVDLTNSSSGLSARRH